MKVLAILLVITLSVSAQELMGQNYLPVTAPAKAPSAILAQDIIVNVPTPITPSPERIERESNTDGLENEPIPMQFWVFLMIFTAMILLVVRKNRRDAANRTVIATRSDLTPSTLSAQLNYHQSEIARLNTLLKYYEHNQQMNQRGRMYQEYPAQYARSVEVEMGEHPRYM